VYTRTNRLKTRSVAGRRSLIPYVGGFLVFSVILSVSSLATTPVGEDDIVWAVDRRSDWTNHTDVLSHVDIRASENVGDNFDLMGNGSLLLKKVNDDERFHQSNYFLDNGQWTSIWYDFGKAVVLESVLTDLITYGGEIDFTEWTLFENNPVACAADYRHKKRESALLPPEPTGQPQDQSVILGSGPYEGKWLLLFNIGSYALNGWGGMVADSLDPLKRGVNPFRLITDPYPMHGPGERQAPNDWIQVDGVYYTAATTPGPVTIWTSPDLSDWTHVGPLYNQLGSDPGIVYDGEEFHLFIEDRNYIRHCLLDIGNNRCISSDIVLDVKTETGDPDVVFFNNRWHMFIDARRQPDRKYEIGYAWTTPSDFPYGWRLHHRTIFGPDSLTPEQRLESDYTGDPDVALEDETLYLFYENPVRVAFRELHEVREIAGHETRIRIESDRDGDGQPDMATDWHVLEGGKSTLRTSEVLRPIEGTRFRVRIEMRTEDWNKSPLLKNFTVGVKAK
jgi:hypothetical protein